MSASQTNLTTFLQVYCSMAVFIIFAGPAGFTTFLQVYHTMAVSIRFAGLTSLTTFLHIQSVVISPLKNISTGRSTGLIRIFTPLSPLRNISTGLIRFLTPFLLDKVLGGDLDVICDLTALSMLLQEW